eukprot:CAMPEP_0181215480 /NCGR_PEP_ID=MMETSP1096-20121128/26039_1 /TAXON_ID=156174 ORGANISM="Chrysochromulina ericina, Strain CCMP281" /NCGR_SAMPLE_ID=MMETSP1096 /ASSEMBLY_ACC=CAM_ASM_000453 /LENGTH=88 /DNA_ID=CAMNT_0023307345 /DNA_START=494 /DNA_END=760 /DNA_ORIENTATION=+
MRPHASTRFHTLPQASTRFHTHAVLDFPEVPSLVAEASGAKEARDLEQHHRHLGVLFGPNPTERVGADPAVGSQQSSLRLGPRFLVAG